MEDVITDLPPPSRFLFEDLNNFTPSPPPLPSPFLEFSSTDSKKTFDPSLIIIAISSPSLHFLHHLSSKTLVGKLVLPDIPVSGNTINPLVEKKSCNIYTLNDTDEPVMIVLVQFPVTPERSHAVAKLLIGEKIEPKRVLILDSVQSRNFRGKLSPDETIDFKLETSLESKTADSSLINGVDYFPSGSLIDGLSAALLSRCQLKKIKGTLYVSWPDVGLSVLSLVKSLLAKNVLTGINYSMEGGYEVEYLKLSRRKGRIDSDMYT